MRKPQVKMLKTRAKNARKRAAMKTARDQAGKGTIRGAYSPDGTREIRIHAEMSHMRANRSCRYV
jgi:nucleoside diphosphate kinase